VRFLKEAHRLFYGKDVLQHEKAAKKKNKIVLKRFPYF